MKQIKLYFMSLMLVAAINAQAVTILGFDYELNTEFKTAKLTGRHGNSPTLEIAETVTYNDQTYTVTAIDVNACQATPVSSLKLPASIKEIGGYAFTLLEGATVTCFATTPPDASVNAFNGGLEGIPAGVILYVPRKSLDAYKAAIDWKVFTDVRMAPMEKIQIDGLWYNLDPKTMTAELISRQPKGYVYYGNITIPSSVVYEDDTFIVNRIAGSAFYESSVSLVNIPTTVTSIGDWAFAGCDNLIALEVPSSVTEMGSNIFYQDTRLRLVKLSENLKAIEEFTFAKCVKLEEIDIPASVKYIGKRAFGACYEMAQVTIGAGMDSISEDAFDECEGIYWCYVNAPVPPKTGADLFSQSPLLEGIYPPCGKLDEYKAAEGWSAYKDLIKYDDYFEYTITIVPSEFGTVKVPQNWCDMFLTAVPNEGYKFVQWKDGNTQNPRPIELTQDTSFEAVFEVIMCDFTVTSNNPEWGTASSAFNNPPYAYNTAITASANARPGYKFYKWNVGYKDNPYTFNIKDNTALIALFVAEEVVPQETKTEVNETSVVFEWPIINNANIYSLHLFQFMPEDKDKYLGYVDFDQNGNVVEEHLDNGSEESGKAPKRAKKLASNFSYTIKGLDPEAKYNYAMEARNAEKVLINTDLGSFETQASTTGITNTKANANARKVLVNGQLLILHADKTYNALGQPVK